MQKSIDWLCAYFSTKGSLPEDLSKVNYFEVGLIDSFGVIELIETIEQEFNIQFKETHFQDRRFATISGLAEIITQLQTHRYHEG